MNQDSLENLRDTIQSTITEGICVYKETLIRLWHLVGTYILLEFNTLEDAKKFIQKYKKDLVPPCNEKNLEISILFAHDNPDIKYYFTTVGKEMSWKRIRDNYENIYNQK